MPTNAFDRQFHSSYKKFIKGTPSLKQKVNNILIRFSQNPQYPSLRLEKLQGSNIWTIRVDRGNRLFFIWSSTGDTAIFFLVGPHDSYRKLGN